MVQETAIWVADGVTFMQAELVAINAALLIAEQERAQATAIHTDLLSSIQSLQLPAPADN